MGKFSDNFKFMNRHKRADFSNEGTCDYYRGVLMSLVERNFKSGAISPHIEVLEEGKV